MTSQPDTIEELWVALQPLLFGAEGEGDEGALNRSQQAVLAVMLAVVDEAFRTIRPFLRAEAYDALMGSDWPILTARIEALGTEREAPRGCPRDASR